MAHAKNHDYHILHPSIWPLTGALGAFVMFYGAVLGMQQTTDSLGAFFANYWLFVIGLAAVLYVMFAWWSDVVREAQSGDHTPVVRIGLRYGFIMFIMSEVMFFLGLVLDLLQARHVSDGARSRPPSTASGRRSGSRRSTPGTCR